MNKNRLLLGLGVISLLLVSLAVSSFQVKPTSSNIEVASDFHQRHPRWTWVVAAPASTASDYFQRHPEMTPPSVIGIGASDYFQRHPELIAPSASSADLTDYYFRQQALKRTGSDLTDYYFRHIGN